MPHFKPCSLLLPQDARLKKIEIRVELFSVDLRTLLGAKAASLLAGQCEYFSSKIRPVSFLPAHKQWLKEAGLPYFSGFDLYSPWRKQLHLTYVHFWFLGPSSSCVTATSFSDQCGRFVNC
jgi:hypothetical protein